jgi:hypothetical protein
VRIPTGVRAESTRTPNASRAGALHSHIHSHLHIEKPVVPSIGNHRVAQRRPVDNWPHIPAMDGGE